MLPYHLDIGRNVNANFQILIPKSLRIILFLCSQTSQLESVYRTSPLVLNVCIHAESNFSRPTAIISPSIPAINKLAAEHGLDSSSQSISSFLNSGPVQNIVTRELQNVARKSELASFEVIDYVVIVEEEWTPESGLVTPAMKLKRREIVDRYGKYDKSK